LKSKSVEKELYTYKEHISSFAVFIVQINNLILLKSNDFSATHQRLGSLEGRLRLRKEGGSAERVHRTDPSGHCTVRPLQYEQEPATGSRG